MLSWKLEARFLKQLWKQSVPSSMLPAVFGSALARRCWQHLCEYVVFRLSLEVCVKAISQLIIVVCEHCAIVCRGSVVCAVETSRGLRHCVIVSVLPIVDGTWCVCESAIDAIVESRCWKPDF